MMKVGTSRSRLRADWLAAIKACAYKQSPRDTGCGVSKFYIFISLGQKQCMSKFGSYKYCAAGQYYSENRPSIQFHAPFAARIHVPSAQD
jgi:hypothetical protein